jgi:hypothetical protein
LVEREWRWLGGRENFDAAFLLVELMGCTSRFVAEPCDGTDQNWYIAMYGPPPRPPIPGIPGNPPTPPLPAVAVTVAIVDYLGEPDPRPGSSAMWLDYGDTATIFFADYFSNGQPIRPRQLGLPSRPDVGSYLVRPVSTPLPEPNTSLQVMTVLLTLGLLTALRRGRGPPLGELSHTLSLGAGAGA